VEHKELRKRARFWKKELGIANWTLRFKFVESDSPELGNNHALIQPVPEHSTAKLWIWLGSPYVEFWMIHELGHIVLAGLTGSPGYNLLEEQSINRYTRALCRAHKIPCPTFEAL
jgi:hypothetical protein